MATASASAPLFYTYIMSLCLLQERAEEDRQFPDEVDVPFNQPASVRFAKYRGLQSFKHSKWDAMEDLPPEYARIFKFQNFTTTRHNILRQRRELEDDPEVIDQSCGIGQILDWCGASCLGKRFASCLATRFISRLTARAVFLSAVHLFSTNSSL